MRIHLHKGSMKIHVMLLPSWLLVSVTSYSFFGICLSHTSKVWLLDISAWSWEKDRCSIIQNTDAFLPSVLCALGRRREISSRRYLPTTWADSASLYQPLLWSHGRSRMGSLRMTLMRFCTTCLHGLTSNISSALMVCLLVIFIGLYEKLLSALPLPLCRAVNKYRKIVPLLFYSLSQSSRCSAWFWRRKAKEEWASIPLVLIHCSQFRICTGLLNL